MKVLFFVNAWALAHVSRAIEISNELKNRGHEILFAGKGNYLSIAQKSGFPYRDINGPSLDDVRQVLESGNIQPITSYQRMKEDLDESLALCKEWNPDVIFSDNRIVARTAGDILNVPVISVMNAHITNYQKVPFISWPEKLPIFSKTLSSLQVKFERFLMDKFMFKNLKKLRKEYGLKKLYSYEHEEGHLTIIPDIEEFNPTSCLPERVKITGPLMWKPNFPPPKSLKKLNPNIPTIYFSLGSHALKLSPKMATLLGKMPIQFVLSLGSDSEDSVIDLPENFFVENFVDMDLLLPHCQTIICHGGNGTIYKALSHGLPVIGIPQHPEQAQNMKQVERLNMGIKLNKNFMNENNGHTLIETINQVIKKPLFKDNAKRISKKILQSNGPVQACNIAEDFVRNFLGENELQSPIHRTN